MDGGRKSTYAMHTLLLCSDLQFLGATRGVLHQLEVAPKIVGSSEDALGMIHAHEFDVVVVDWRDVPDLADFLGALRRSKLNGDCVLVAIVRDLLDLRQAFSAGVHFLIHKPASVVQIERCLRAAYSARVTRRRKQHREAVNIAASVSTRVQPYAEAMIMNLSEAGACLQMDACCRLGVAEEIDLRFELPGSGTTLHATGTVIWISGSRCGIRFSDVPDGDRLALEQWLTVCVERSLEEMCERMRTVCA